MGTFKHHVGQVTYPKMERQDLTQSQLGAFKFTPTDEVRPVFAQLPPLLIKPLPGSPVARYAPTHFIPSTHHNQSQHTSPSSASPTRGATFVNQRIRPNFADPRVSLRSDTTRAAADGSSPTHKARHWDAEALFRAVQADIMRSKEPGNPHESVYSNLDPSMPAFTRTTTDAGLDNNNILYASLIRALATEQRAHETTKHALELEKAARIEAERTATNWREHNQSLIGSVNLLKSLVQHNMKKEQEQSQQAEVATNRNSAESALPKETRIPQHSDPNPYAITNAMENETNTDRSSEDVHLFNLNIPDTPEYASLRRHFSDATEIVSSSDSKPLSSDRLIQLDAEQAAGEGSSGRNANSKVCGSSEGLKESTTQDPSTPLKDKTNAKKSPVMMAMPFDVPVKWAATPIFEDHQDKINHLGYMTPNRVTNFYKYPVRYTPNKAENNLYRTIMVDFIPLGTACADVLTNVRGGAIESIQLFEPIGSATDFMTARIVFNYELAARGMYMRGQNAGIYINGHKVRVWHVLEPTYPRSAALKKEIFEEGFTRLLLIEGATATALAALGEKLNPQFKAGFIIAVSRTFDNLPMIEFTSVVECSKALQFLLDDKDFAGARFDFEEDPCIEPY